MGLASTIEFAELEDLYLDPTNPRLGRANSGPDVSQDRVLDLMRGWSLEELAVSFLESGFWPQEAVIVVREALYGEPQKLVVVEGNRRIAALRYLQDALDRKPFSRAWKQLADTAGPVPADLFTKIPYIVADSRSDVVAFLGFRHVTGIKEWNPAEKAEYIAHLVDDLDMSYDEVRRKIGSRPDTVRRNYIAFKIYKQMEDIGDGIALERVEQKFSVLFLSLREAGVRQFLDVDVRSEPEDAKQPVAEDRLEDLARFASWLFGTEEIKPLFTDSRYVGDFGKILASGEAVEYLKSTPEPSFDLALQKAGVEEQEVLEHIKEATDHIELALSRAHLYAESAEIRKAMRRFRLGVRELLQKFPEVEKDLETDERRED